MKVHHTVLEEQTVNWCQLKWFKTVVIYAATWATFKPNLDKIKKIQPEKKFLYFRKWNFLLTFDKAPLGDTGCLSSLLELRRIHFRNCSLKKYIFKNCFL